MEYFPGKPVKPFMDIGPKDMGYGCTRIWGNVPSAQAKRWLDTLANMTLEFTKFLPRQKVMELYMNPEDARFKAYIDWRDKKYGPQKYIKEHDSQKFLSSTYATSHMDSLPEMKGDPMTDALYQKWKFLHNISAGFGEAQAAGMEEGKEHIDFMAGGAQHNRFSGEKYGKWGSGEADWAGVFQDMPLSRIKNWDVSDGKRYGDVNTDVLPVEYYDGFFGSLNTLSNIAPTASLAHGIDADFADWGYGNFYANARSFVDSRLKTSSLGYKQSFYELALSEMDGQVHKTEIDTSGGLAGTVQGVLGTSSDNYSSLFSTPEEVFKLAMVMLESRRRDLQAETLLQYSFRALETAHNKLKIAEAVASKGKVQGFVDYDKLKADGAHTAKLSVDSATIDWWDTLKNHQFWKEAGEFNKMFFQFMYSFQHYKTILMNAIFNPTAGRGRTTGNDYAEFDIGGELFYVDRYFTYPFYHENKPYYPSARAYTQNEIENKGIFLFAKYMAEKLRDYQTIYTNNIKNNQKGIDCFNMAKSVYDNWDAMEAEDPDDFDNWRSSSFNSLKTLITDLYNIPGYIGTMSQKELMRKLQGMQANQFTKTLALEIYALVDYWVNGGAGVREFRAEYFLGKPCFGIDPYREQDNSGSYTFDTTATKSKYKWLTIGSNLTTQGIISSKIQASALGYTRQPETGDSRAWDMTDGFTRGDSGGLDSHVKHVYKIFQKIGLGNIKGVGTDNLIMTQIDKGWNYTIDENGALHNDTGSPVKYFGGKWKKLYHTVGLFRMKADLRSYDRMLNIMFQSIRMGNRMKKLQYEKRIEEWEEEKYYSEMIDFLIERRKQNAEAESKKSNTLMRLAEMRQRQEDKGHERKMSVQIGRKKKQQSDFIEIVARKRAELKKERQISARVSAADKKGMRSALARRMGSTIDRGKLIGRSRAKKMRG